MLGPVHVNVKATRRRDPLTRLMNISFHLSGYETRKNLRFVAVLLSCMLPCYILNTSLLFIFFNPTRYAVETRVEYLIAIQADPM